VIRDYARQLDREASLNAPAAPPVPTYQPPTYRRYVPPAPIYTPPSSGTSYDWQSGNVYRWRKPGDGTTRVDGSNLNTGSMWNTTIKPNGSMSGTDSNFNMWNYDAGSKTYMNYGTGKMCVGEGYARVCTK
jgi:hypothetical protein